MSFLQQTGGGCGGSPIQAGGASDFMSSFYAQGAVGGPGAISRTTAANINNAPMFNSLSASAVIPTLPSTGIVPSEVYLADAQIGGASDYMHSFYSRSVSGGPGPLTRATLDNINNAPMFHPLQANAVIPTLPSTGIVPSEVYLANMTGGGRMRGARLTNNQQPSLDQLRAACNKAGLSCRDRQGRFLPRNRLVQLLKSKSGYRF
jgi:hypothetical protein